MNSKPLTKRTYQTTHLRSPLPQSQVQLCLQCESEEVAAMMHRLHLEGIDISGWIPPQPVANGDSAEVISLSTHKIPASALRQFRGLMTPDTKAVMCHYCLDSVFETDEAYVDIDFDPYGDFMTAAENLSEQARLMLAISLLLELLATLQSKD